MQTRSATRSTATLDSVSDAKNISEFADVNAFDRNIWLGLYHDIDKPAAAQAVLEMSGELPILVKLYPALIVRARQTLIHDEIQRTRRASRMAVFKRFLASIVGLCSKLRTPGFAVPRQARRMHTFPKRSGSHELNRP